LDEKNVYLILSGELEISFSEKRKYWLKEGNIFGDFECLVRNYDFGKKLFC
jgi:hypothetical protein